MGRAKVRTVLFLCTGNYYRSRFAECLFNAAAAKVGLPWAATSRGLALERGVANVGPMAASAVRALRAMGVRGDGCDRMPAQAAPADFETADLVVALKDSEHRPLLHERYPGRAEKVEFWHVEDDPGALAHVEREVMDLIARLTGGGGKPPADAPPAPAASQRPSTPERFGEKPVVRVGRQTKGRRGRGVTTVSDLPLDEAGLQELAARLKQRCGTGGTVRGGVIEVQGDYRDRLAAELEALGYRVKRAGG